MMFRTLSDRTTVPYDQRSSCRVNSLLLPTLIFSNVLQRKGQASILALYYPHLAKGTFADNSE